MSKLPLLLVLALAGCGNYPGPSVPMQSGKTIEQANAAIRACAPYAPQGGKNALVGNYVGSILLAGVIIGPIVVASNEDPIRAQGEADPNLLGALGDRHQHDVHDPDTAHHQAHHGDGDEQHVENAENAILNRAKLGLTPNAEVVLHPFGQRLHP